MGTGLEGIPTWRDGACKSCALETVVEQNMLSLAVIVWHRRDVLTRCLHGQFLLGCIVFSVPIRRQLMCRIFLLVFFSGLEVVSRQAILGSSLCRPASARRPEMRGHFPVRSVRNPTTARQDMLGGNGPDRGKEKVAQDDRRGRSKHMPYLMRLTNATNLHLTASFCLSSIHTVLLSTTSDWQRIHHVDDPPPAFDSTGLGRFWFPIGARLGLSPTSKRLRLRGK